MVAPTATAILRSRATVVPHGVEKVGAGRPHPDGHGSKDPGGDVEVHSFAKTTPSPLPVRRRSRSSRRGASKIALLSGPAIRSHRPASALDAKDLPGARPVAAKT